MKIVSIISVLFMMSILLGDEPVMGSLDLSHPEGEPNTVVAMDESMLYPAYAFVAERVEDKIYVIGGRKASGSYVENVQIYDINSKRWSLGPEIPSPREGMSSGVIDGKIYIAGGLKGSVNYNILEVYDPISNTWEVKSSMNEGRGYATASVVDDKMYVMGGSGSSGSIEVYEPEKDVWSTKSQMMTPRWCASSVSVGEKIYVAGGANIGSYTARGDFEVYDTSNDTWSREEDLLYPAYHLRICEIEGRIYAVGGKASSVYGRIEMFDLNSGRWVEMANINVPRYGFELEVIEDVAYIMGGHGREYLSSMESYIAPTVENEARYLVSKAEGSRNKVDVENAREYVNNLSESIMKDRLQERLNNIFLNVEIKKEGTTSNIDVYIKALNTLSLSLDTSVITFDNFSGVEDMEALNAVNLTVSSSLPYKINTYLQTEIIGTGSYAQMDKSILNIKANEETVYQTFSDSVAPIVLLDGQVSGSDIVHGIDLMLKGNIAHEKDVYKATIKFEVEQK